MAALIGADTSQNKEDAIPYPFGWYGDAEEGKGGLTRFYLPIQT